MMIEQMTPGPATVPAPTPEAKRRRKAPAAPSPATEGSGKKSGRLRGRPENLRPFKPGTSGNPGGRPKGSAGFAERIRKATKEGADLVAVAISIALNEKEPGVARMRAVEYLTDRMVGKALEKVELTGAEGGAIVYRVVWS